MSDINEIMFFITGVMRDFWWVAAPFLAWGIFWELWVQFTDLEFDLATSGTLIEVKLPQELAKSSAPAMEHVLAAFTHIAKVPMLYEKYLQGMSQVSYGLEIVGIEGQVKFFIRSPKERLRYTVSQIYAQFPGAEVVVDAKDYSMALPVDLATNPQSEWDVWGSEFLFLKPDPYPLRTYVDFAMDKPSEEEQRVDPLANIVEALATCGPGEQFWYQILARPEFGWEQETEKLLNKISGRQEAKKPTGVTRIFGALDSVVQMALGKESEAKEEVRTHRFWTDPETKEMQALDRKRSKVGFRCTVRVLYVCKKELFNKRHAQAMLGFFRPFASAYNTLIPDKRSITSQDYFFVKQRVKVRKKDLLWRYRSRNHRKPGSILNIEELATIFHIPGLEVAAPALERVAAKRATGPHNLPINQ